MFSAVPACHRPSPPVGPAPLWKSGADGPSRLAVFVTVLCVPVVETIRDTFLFTLRTKRVTALGLWLSRSGPCPSGQLRALGEKAGRSPLRHGLHPVAALGSLHRDPRLFPHGDMGSSVPGDRERLERGRGWEVGTLPACRELHGTKPQKTQRPANPRSVTKSTDAALVPAAETHRQPRAVVYFLKTRSPLLPSASSGNSRVRLFFNQSWGFWGSRAAGRPCWLRAARVDSAAGSPSPTSREARSVVPAGHRHLGDSLALLLQTCHGLAGAQSGARQHSPRPRLATAVPLSSGLAASPAGPASPASDPGGRQPHAPSAGRSPSSPALRAVGTWRAVFTPEKVPVLREALGVSPRPAGPRIVPSVGSVLQPAQWGLGRGRLASPATPEVCH